jgi:hypothetical protein
MNWRSTIEGQLVPANVLSLIRDGKAGTVSNLRSALGFDDLPPSLNPVIYKRRLREILDDLVAARLVTQEGENLAPTELIAKIQKALHISLTELTEAYRRTESRGSFVEQPVIEQLRQLKSEKHDLAKVVRFCEELNSSYASGNYLATTLLIRALLNHIPPVFGQTTFLQVVSQSGRSVKEVLKPLEEISRDVADLHTHALIRHKETLPTKNQVEPFKANLEILLHEVIARVQGSA